MKLTETTPAASWSVMHLHTIGLSRQARFVGDNHHNLNPPLRLESGPDRHADGGDRWSIDSISDALETVARVLESRADIRLSLEMLVSALKSSCLIAVSSAQSVVSTHHGIYSSTDILLYLNTQARTRMLDIWSSDLTYNITTSIAQ